MDTTWWGRWLLSCCNNNNNNYHPNVIMVVDTTTIIRRKKKFRRSYIIRRYGIIIFINVIPLLLLLLFVQLNVDFVFVVVSFPPLLPVSIIRQNGGTNQQQLLLLGRRRVDDDNRLWTKKTTVISLLLASTTTTRNTDDIIIDPDSSTTTSTTTSSSSMNHLYEETSYNDDNSNDSVGLYIHLPFCRKRCRYCDFAIVPIGNDHHPRTTNDTATTNNKYQQGVTTLMERYINTLCIEINNTINLYKKKHNNNNPQCKIKLRSIYFGGGTPSLVPTELLQRILHTIIGPDSIFEMMPDNNTEITIEMDPGTFTQQTVQELYNIGINRISLGIQSFDDIILQNIGRIHRKSDIIQSIEYLVNVYQDTLNYSIDLITGLPGLSIAKWIETIDIALHQLNPPPQHLSIYDLQIEQGTVFGKWYSSSRIDDDDDDASVRKASAASSSTHHQTVGNNILQQDFLVPSQNPTGGKIIPAPSPLPSPDDCAFMYQYTSHYLQQKGYEHYEVSSYALLKSSTTTKLSTNNNNTTQPSPAAMEVSSSPPPFIRQSYRSTHNQIYWGYNTQWYAFGLGATSCINGTLQARPRTMYDYEQWVENQKRKVKEEIISNINNNRIDPSTAEGTSEDPTDLDVLTDLVLKRLRTSEGLSLNYVRDRFGRVASTTDDNNHNNATINSLAGRNIGDLYVTAILEGAQLGIELGLVEYDPTKQTLQLTKPRGFLFSNTIISSIFVTIEQVCG